MNKVKGAHCYRCEKPLDTKAKRDAAKYIFPLPEATDNHSGGLACETCAPPRPSLARGSPTCPPRSAAGFCHGG